PWRSRWAPAHWFAGVVGEQPRPQVGPQGARPRPGRSAGPPSKIVPLGLEQGRPVEGIGPRCDEHDRRTRALALRDLLGRLGDGPERPVGAEIANGEKPTLRLAGWLTP